MPTTIKVGTFNVNNLFSRYNFKGEIEAIKKKATNVDSKFKYEFKAGDVFKIRTYRGKLVKAKSAKKTKIVAEWIKEMDVDVLAVQEVEDIDTLREFNRDHLDSMYPYVVLIEGNDPRLIDVGFLSKLPIGGITSWQKTVHPADPGQTVFGRDLLEVEILNESRSQKLFTIFNNHLKSHFVPYDQDQVAGKKANNDRRARQSEMIAKIVKAKTRPDSSFIIVGDMNDPPYSDQLNPFVADAELNLVDALENPTETRPPKPDTPPPASAAWTHRYKPSGQPAQYELYDQIWVSSSLKDKLTGAWIYRRKNLLGDGSDHDPAWIELRL